jgi:hypothetical protein
MLKVIQAQVGRSRVPRVVTSGAGAKKGRPYRLRSIGWSPEIEVRRDGPCGTTVAESVHEKGISMTRCDKRQPPISAGLKLGTRADVARAIFSLTRQIVRRGFPIIRRSGLARHRKLVCGQVVVLRKFLDFRAVDDGRDMLAECKSTGQMS